MVKSIGLCQVLIVLDMNVKIRYNFILPLSTHTEL